LRVFFPSIIPSFMVCLVGVGQHSRMIRPSIMYNGLRTWVRSQPYLLQSSNQILGRTGAS
jgi:hypothetical protein